MAELKYEIIKEFGVLSQSPSGWTKELLSLINIYG